MFTHVYVIENADGVRYIGLTTEDLQAVVARHCTGNVPGTKNGNYDWELIWVIREDDQIIASKIKRYLNKFNKIQFKQYILDGQLDRTEIKRRAELLKTTKADQYRQDTYGQ